MPTKRIAAITTIYNRNTHADVIIGKIIEGYNYDGKERPDLEVVSMYVDQRNDGDLSRRLAAKHGFTLYDDIESTITLGKPGIHVDGVVIVAEHGRYPHTQYDQVLYPRRQFFEAVANVFAKYGRSVPVFSDKHLSARWRDARWIYDRSRELFVPFLAGSSVPVAWRRPNLELPRGVDIEEAVAIGYGPAEGYGFHALEGLQCMVERRKGGETGVKSVQFLSGVEMWPAQQRGAFSLDLTEAAVGQVGLHAKGDYRKLTTHHGAGVMLIEYLDGLRAAMILLNGYVYDGDGSFNFACRVRGQKTPIALQFNQQQVAPYAHFRYQLKAIEAMIHSGHAPYPVERTLLTTGILDAAMISRGEMNRKLPTPHLAIRYSPTDYPFARDPVPPPIKR